MGSEIFSENIKFPQRGNFIRQFYSLVPAKAGTPCPLAKLSVSENTSSPITQVYS